MERLLLFGCTAIGVHDCPQVNIIIIAINHIAAIDIFCAGISLVIVTTTATLSAAIGTWGPDAVKCNDAVPESEFSKVV